MEIDSLKEFLVESKIATYANENPEKKSLEDGGLELEFEKKIGQTIWTYRDRYYGNDPFSGQEVVFENSTPVWTMNYYGRILADPILKSAIYGFLREALRTVPKDKPFRGRRRCYSNHENPLNEGLNFFYSCTSVGEVDWFFGREEIELTEKHREKVYELVFHGGFVSKI